MTFLDNGEVRVGMDLALGGAITFISSKDHPGNIINSFDLGRQIQMSQYSGPVPFEIGDKKPHKNWVGIGWNPIQTGDCYMNPSKVLEHRNNGKELYIKCIPMQWPLDNVPGECVFETWTTLEGPVIRMRYRCTNQRSDKTQYPPRGQELPAVYTISKLWRLMSYTGDKPFTQDALTRVTNDWKKPWPWTRFQATERWAALVDDNDWGLGVFKDDGDEFHGGIFGDERSEDPMHFSTAYVAPVHSEIFDHNIVYDYKTTFIVGKLADIRKRCNEMATKTPPAWHFDTDRQHWIVRNATDQGFPLKGEWRIKFGARKPRLTSANQSWRAESAQRMDLEISYKGHPTAARLFWKRQDDNKFDNRKSLTLDLIPDGKYHTYRLDLASYPEYSGLITGLAIEPVSKAHPDEEIAIKSIVLRKERQWTSLLSGKSAMRAHTLLCESRDNPVGIDAAPPCLSWNLASERRGDRQSAFQVLVSSSSELLAKNRGDLWDSGKVMSDQTAYIPYGGKTLGSAVQCFWKVRVWDGKGNLSAWSHPAFWSMGLLKPEDWKAKWITASRWFMPPDRRPPGFMTTQSGSPDSPAWSDVDLGKPEAINSIKLWANTPGSFPVRFRIEASNELDYNEPKVIVDCSDKDYVFTNSGPVEFPGQGVKARYVRLFIVRSPETTPGSKSFRSVVRQMEIMSGGKNISMFRPTREFGSDGNEGHSTFLVDGMPSFGEGDVCPADACPTTAAPHLRKPFQLDRDVKQATLYYSAMGMAEVTINGRKVSDDVLGPPFSDYTKRVYYNTCDIAPLLVRGENVIGATLGNGFFSPPGRGFCERRNGSGQPRFLAQIEIEYADGTRRTLASDETWKWARSEITFNDLWQGYSEDRRLAKPGWDCPGYNEADWSYVQLAESLGGVLRAPLGPPSRVVGELKPSRVETNHAFFDVLSAGWPRVKVTGSAGQVITIGGRCAHDLNLPPLTFTLATNGETVLEPRFAFLSGPLELWVEGITNSLTRSAISIQRVRADFDLVGSFTCSNPYFNTLHEVVERTHLNYNLEHPLDPMREKDGWTQDAQGMFNTAAYLTDVSGLYRKWWNDMADNQDDLGLLGSVVPVVGRQVNHWNCPSWSGVIVFLPWEHYLYYGDRRMLENAYEPMRRYVDYLDHLASAGAGVNVMDYPDVHYNADKAAAKERMIIWLGAGDWLNPYAHMNNAVSAPLIAMPAWVNYATIVSKTAKMLGKDADAAKYAAMAQDVRDRFNAKYFHPGTGLYGDQTNNQTAQLLPFAFGVVPDDKRELTFQRLLDAIHARNDHLGTGFVGLPYLLQTLTTTDQSALANCIVNQKDFPSWNTLMHHGVLSEVWNGGGAQMPACGGAVGMWLYQSVLGIRPDPSGPGFKRFIIAPQPDPATGLTSAKGSYLSVHGKISSRWKIESGKLSLAVTIPANTTATLRVPTADLQSVTEGNLPVSKAKGVKVIGSEGKILILEVGSGNYEFSAKSVN